MLVDNVSMYIRNIKNNNGPITDPCGTHEEKFRHFVSYPYEIPQSAVLFGLV